MMTRNTLVATTASLAIALGLFAVPQAAQAKFRQKISHDMSLCGPGGGPAVRVNIRGIGEPKGTIRVQSYRGVKDEWLVKGKWLYRIELPARGSRMTVCMPLPAPGTYAIAVRHDVNDNGDTDFTVDGGAMSNNPSINIFNLGKPSYKETRFDVGNEVKTITINMRYL